MKIPQTIDKGFAVVLRGYGWVLDKLIIRPIFVGIILVGLAGVTWQFTQTLDQEYVPTEDHGSFFVAVRGPEGASFDYMENLSLIHI